MLEVRPHAGYDTAVLSADLFWHDHSRTQGLSQDDQRFQYGRAYA